MDKKYDVFISYRRSDSSERAQLIREILKGKGYDEKRIFLDVHSIHEGEFPDRIKQALSESKAFVLLISNDSFHGESKTIDYYYEEIKQALDLKISFIPILFDNIKIETVDLPKELKEKELILKNAISYHPEYKDGFENRLCDFLSEKRRFRDLFVIPTAIITIYVIITFLSGLGLYIHDNYFLSRSSQIEIATKAVGVKDGVYYYPLPEGIITYNATNDSLDFIDFGHTSLPIINSQISKEQGFKAGFWTFAVGTIYGIAKVKVKPHGGKQYIAYIATGVAIVAGVGMGCVLERMLFPIQFSSRIQKNLKDKDFWKEVIIKKTSINSTQLNL